MRSTARLRQELDAYAAHQAYPDFLPEGERGLCADYPYPDYFTEEGARAKETAMRMAAKSVCYACPFRVACRDWALEHEAQGVYGATTTQERRVMRAGGRKAML